MDSDLQREQLELEKEELLSLKENAEKMIKELEMEKKEFEKQNLFLSILLIF